MTWPGLTGLQPLWGRFLLGLFWLERPASPPPTTWGMEDTKQEEFRCENYGSDGRLVVFVNVTGNNCAFYILRMRGKLNTPLLGTVQWAVYI